MHGPTNVIFITKCLFFSLQCIQFTYVSLYFFKASLFLLWAFATKILPCRTLYISFLMLKQQTFLQVHGSSKHYKTKICFLLYVDEFLQMYIYIYIYMRVCVCVCVCVCVYVCNESLIVH